MYNAKWNKKGNIKIGSNAVWSFSKLAGAGEINGCKGTCTGCCEDGCYDVKEPKRSLCYMFPIYVRYGWDTSTVVKSHIRNTNAMRASVENTFKELAMQINKAKKKPDLCRINVSGEIESVEELQGWINLAKKYPTIPFYLYTKAYKIVGQALTNNKTLPENFYINISIWHKSGIECYNKWSSYKNVKAFIYDDGYDYKAEKLKINCYCPAYVKGKNGKVKLTHDLTCSKCKLCFNDKAKVIGCYDH